MKRHFLSTICSLAMVAFMGQAAVAQQETTPSSNNSNVVIIQKTLNDDGTWTVKKKSIQKGQPADAYLKEVESAANEDKTSEFVVITGDDTGVDNANGETVIYVRSGKHKKEVKWGDMESGEFKFEMPDMSDLALIGDEQGEPTMTKAFLGIYPESNENGGVLVTDIVAGSGAAAAGLKSGDVITGIDGETLRAHGDLSRVLATHVPGDAINITYLRNGETLSTTAELTGKQQERHFRYNYVYRTERGPCDVFIGVQIGSYGSDSKGVGVDGIIPGWPAEAAGLQAGDRIVSIDGVPVNTHNELVVERDKHKPGEFFTIGYLRDGEESKVEAQFKVCPNQEQPAPVVEEQVQPKETELPRIDNTLELEELNAFPNPTYGDLNVKFRGEAAPTTVTITDITGKTIFNESLPNFDGYYDRQIDVSKGAPGTLMITIRQDGKLLTKPVVLLNRA